MTGSAYDQDLAAIRRIVGATNARVEQIATRQDELVQTVEALAASVDKLNTSFSTIKVQLAEIAPPPPQDKGGATAEDIYELRQKMADIAETLGTSVSNLHRDFGMLTRQVGPALDQVQKTVGPFAAAVSDFAAVAPPGNAWCTGGQQQQQQQPPY